MPPSRNFFLRFPNLHTTKKEKRKKKKRVNYVQLRLPFYSAGQTKDWPGKEVKIKKELLEGIRHSNSLCSNWN